MRKDLVGLIVMTQIIKIQPTKSAHTSSKVYARKERNVFTLTIPRLIEQKKSIFTLIREPSWLWTQLEEKSWASFQKMIWTRFWERNNWKWWRVQDQRLCASSFWRQLKRINTDGNGIVQMAIHASINIAFLQDIYWRKMRRGGGKTWLSIKKKKKDKGEFLF